MVRTAAAIGLVCVALGQRPGTTDLVIPTRIAATPWCFWPIAAGHHLGVISAEDCPLPTN